MQFPIVINYKISDEWHIYITEAFPGFYVASRDKELARKELVPAINKLIEYDTGVDVGITEDQILIIQV